MSNELNAAISALKKVQLTLDQLDYTCEVEALHSTTLRSAIRHLTSAGIDLELFISELEEPKEMDVDSWTFDGDGRTYEDND